MKRLLSSQFVAAAVLSVAAFGAASSAQARPDIQVTIGLPGLPGLPFFPPPPVVVWTEPVVVAPRPVYAPPPAVVVERDWRPADRYEYARERGWHHREWERQEWERREWERRHRHERDDHRRGLD